jgi:hypothetical protein
MNDMLQTANHSTSPISNGIPEVFVPETAIFIPEFCCSILKQHYHVLGRLDTIALDHLCLVGGIPSGTFITV